MLGRMKRQCHLPLYSGWKASSCSNQLIRLLSLIARIHEAPEDKALGYWLPATVEQFSGDGKRMQGFWSQMVAFKGAG